MMNICYDNFEQKKKTHSGVHLDYTPEDTLTSFVMESRLSLINDIDRHEHADTNSHNCRPLKTLKPCSMAPKNNKNPKPHNDLPRLSDKPLEQEKRPYLRKNHGRAAWSCRLRPSGYKIQEDFSPMQHSSNVADTQNNSGDQIQIPQNSCSKVETKTISGRSSKIYSHFSQWNPLPNYQLYSVPQESMEESCLAKSPILCNESKIRDNDSTQFLKDVEPKKYNEERELEEFELLERIADDRTRVNEQNFSMSRSPSHPQSSLPDVNTDSGDIDVYTYNRRLTDDDYVIGPADSNCQRGVTIVNSPHVGRDFQNCANIAQSLSQLTDNRIEFTKTTSVSSDLDDQIPWQDDPPDAPPLSCCKLQSTRQQTHPIVRFSNPSPRNAKNLPACHLPKAEACNSVEGSSVASESLIKDWIVRLETEVSRFNTENLALAKLKSEREASLAALEKEREEFELYKKKTMTDFETYRLEVIAKFKKERKVLTDYQQSLQSMPNKKDRQEIEHLKQQIVDDKTESAQRESRLQQEVSRQRIRIEELSTDKLELLDRIKRLEQSRLVLQNLLSEEQSSQALQLSKSKMSSQTDSTSQNIPHHPRVSDFGGAATTQSKDRAALTDPTSSDSKVVARLPTPSIASVTEELVENSIPSLPQCNVSQQQKSQGHRRTRTSSTASDYYTGEEDFTADANCTMRESRGPLVREMRHPDGSIERSYSDGSRTINYANGSKKEIFPDGISSVVYLFNKDVKRTKADGTIIYTYAAEGTIQTTFPDKTEEIIYQDGRKEMNFYAHAPGLVQATPVSVSAFCGIASNSPPRNGPIEPGTRQPQVVEDCCLPGGMSVKIFSNGDKIISLPNGQKELHCEDFKRRVYPDGTLKTVFKDGRQETRYASGRIRVKDSVGNLLLDTRIAPSFSDGC